MCRPSHYSGPRTWESAIISLLLLKHFCNTFHLHTAWQSTLLFMSHKKSDSLTHVSMFYGSESSSLGFKEIKVMQPAQA